MWNGTEIASMSGMRRLLASLIVVLLLGCGSDDSAGKVTGSWGGPGREAGRFVKPRGVAVDRKRGVVYVVDMSGRCQKFTMKGQFLSSWRLPDARLGTGEGMVVTASGELLMADTHYHRVLRYSPEGDFLGSFGGQGRKPGQLLFPTAVAVDATGSIYVAEYGGGNRVQKFDSKGKFQQVIGRGSIGSEPGQFQRPSGLAVEADGNILVADAANHRIQRLSPGGKPLASFGRRGSGPGEFHYPYDVAALPDGSFAVVDNYNNRIQRLSADGKHLGSFGGPGRDLGEFSRPWCLAVGSGGGLFVTDTLNHRLQVVRLDGVEAPEAVAAAAPLRFAR